MRTLRCAVSDLSATHFPPRLINPFSFAPSSDDEKSSDDESSSDDSSSSDDDSSSDDESFSRYGPGDPPRTA